MLRICEKCHEVAEPCENHLDNLTPSDIHDHEYDEWYCESCWSDYTDEEKGVTWYEVVDSE